MNNEQDKNRDQLGRFVPGNNAAEKWNEKTVLETLQKMWETLIEGHEEVSGNYVRANDIKTLAEVCLMHNIGKQRWSEWKKDFAENDAVSELIKRIEWVIETRLVYSGQTMDIFVLKNHYDYKDARQMDLGNKDGIPFETANRTNIIDYTKLPDEVLDALIAASQNSK